MITITKESIKQELDYFNDEQLKQVADFIEFIKFQTKFTRQQTDVSQFANLYQEFAQEDRELAEAGISEYSELLNREDKNASGTGEIWLANLDPTKGSEQAGTRPIIIFQENTISKFTSTIITIPLTTNLRRAALPSCLLLSNGQGGLNQDSVALCHQLRVLDKTRLIKRLGQIDINVIAELERTVLFTLGYQAL